jgi:hypothetical protein
LGVLDSIYSLFGVTPPTREVDVPPRKDWPGADDVAMADRYDTTYGSDVAPMLGPGGRVKVVPSTRAAIPQLNSETPDFGKATSPLTGEQRAQMLKAWIAAQRSPVAALGFDPRQMAITPAGAGPPLTVAGMQFPNSDQIWFDGRYDTTPVHESTHRGFTMMRKAGVDTPSEGSAEERKVRSLMLQHFGEAEKGRGALGDEQVETAKAWAGDHNVRQTSEMFERLAASLGKVRGRPMGPR